MTWMAFATVLIGTFGVSSKIVLQYFDPLLAGGLRLLLSSFAIAVFSMHMQHKVLNRRVGIKMILNACMHTTFSVLYFIGLNRSQAINSALLGLLTPMFIYIGSIVFLKESFIPKTLLGAAVSLIGGVALVAVPAFEEGSFTLSQGDLFLLLAYVVLAATVLHTKQLYKDVTPHQILSYRMLFGSIVLISLSMLFGESLDVGIVPWSGWLALVYSAVIVGGIGLMIFYAALKYMKAEESAALFYVDPLVAVVASAAVLGEQLGEGALIAGALIVCGVLISHPAHVHRMHYYHAPQHEENLLRRFLEKTLHLAHLK